MTDPPGFIDESATSMTFYWVELRRGTQHQGEMEDSVQGVLELSCLKVFGKFFDRFLSDASPPDAVFSMPFPPSCE